MALSWGAVTRIEAVLAAQRKRLVPPGDVGNIVNFALLEIHERKTSSGEIGSPTIFAGVVHGL